MDPVLRPAAPSAAPPAPGARERHPIAVVLAAAGPLLALCAVLMLRYWPTLSTPGPLMDEVPYLAAFEATHRGESPYTLDGYLYSPAFAVLGGEARRWLSIDTLDLLLRSANILATATIAWLAATLLPWAATTRWIASAVYLALSPGVSLAMHTGNVSPLAAALVIVGLFVWMRTPMVGGFLLAASLGVKPVGAPVAPLLLVHRSSSGGRRQWWASAAALVTSLVMLLAGIEYLGEFLSFGASLTSDDFRVARTFSLHRLLLSLGLPVGRTAVAIVVTLGAMVLARSRSWTQRDFLCLAIAASCLVTPALWPHTMLLALPVQVLALARALRLDGARSTGSRAPELAAADRRRRLYEVILVVCAALTVQWSDGIGGLDPNPSIGLAAALLPPVLSTPLLAWYVVRRPRA